MSCTTWRYSSSLRPQPRAAATRMSSTAQHRLRQLVSPGKRPDDLRSPPHFLERALQEVGRSGKLTVCARSRLAISNFCHQFEKCSQPAPGSSLAGMFDQFLHRTRKICKLAAIDSAAGRYIRSFEILGIGSDRVDIGHVLVGIEASRRQKPASVLPWVPAAHATRVAGPSAATTALAAPTPSGRHPLPILRWNTSWNTKSVLSNAGGEFG